MVTSTTAARRGETQKSTWGFREGEEIAQGRWALKLLGGGRRYEAYLAWDHHMSSLVVAKLLRPDRVESSSSLHSLAFEAELLDRLAHPVVVRCFAAVLQGPRPHLVLEHLEGPTLHSLIRRYGPLPLEQLIPLALRLCGALHYLGQEDIVHLDVKPRNVVMESTPRLIDFSIARPVSETHKIRAPLGTDAYMAPEQCRPEAGQIAPAADMWGLGATLYHAVTGKLPFPRTLPGARDIGSDRHPQIAEDPEPIPANVPPVIADIVLDCLAGDPSARPLPEEVAMRLEPLVAMLPRRPALNRFRPRLR
jgi:eukaryotic-like serine/threonine-protein kinase